MKNNIKKVSINEEALVELIYDITERTINERIEKGELTRVNGPVHPELKKTKKITVSESEYKALKKAGKVISAVKKQKLV